MALTVKQVERIKEAGRHGDGHGLYLQVMPGGARSWLLRYERGGRERWMGLGACHTFSLDEARDRARAARQQLANGIDPLDARRAERTKKATEAAAAAKAGVTFEEVAGMYFNLHSPKWKNVKHISQWMSSMKRDVFPTMGRVPIAAIDKTLVIRMLEKIWFEKANTASRIRGRVKNVLDFAKANDFRSGDNPAAWTENLKHALPAPKDITVVKPHAAMAYTDMYSFMADLRSREGIAAKALEFTILTAARSAETIGAAWNEISFDKKTWTIPRERMKMARKMADKEHRVPLSDRAIALLQALPREGDLVFVGAQAGAPMGINAMSDLLGTMRGDATVHGMRSTFRDWAAECTNFPRELAEKALSHNVGDETERAYQRGDLLNKRRRLMEAWSTYCDRPATSGAVVPLHRSA
jgi:integrase